MARLAPAGDFPMCGHRSLIGYTRIPSSEAKAVGGQRDDPESRRAHAGCRCSSDACASRPVLSSNSGDTRCSASSMASTG
jgi:hypothetical protein